MAYTTIDNGEEHFNTILYTGDGSADNDITGVGFAPDWVWAKNRGAADAHWVLDSTRGATKGLYTNGTAAENTQNHLISFDSDGFSVGNQANGLNTSSNNYVAWNWKANGGTTSSNSNGTITSTVQANTTAGFSIITYTGNFTNNQTIGHGLNQAPEALFIKNRDSSTSWVIYNKGLNFPTKDLVYFNSNPSNDHDPTFNDTAPSSSVITMGAYSFNNKSGDSHVCYAFHSVKGYSKFGAYIGNGNADGPFVYTGFKPALLITKVDNSGNWFIVDNKRDTDNEVQEILFPNLSNAETTGSSGSNRFDFLSNGFKVRGNGSAINVGSNRTFYFAFAEHPFVSSKGVPVTAR